MSKKTVFIVISFNKKFKNVYDKAIKPAIEACGLNALKADGEDKAIRDIYTDIAEKLVSAELVIVDISKVEDNNGKEISLDNVYYELGLAHGINKKVIFLTQNTDKDIPYDLRRLEAINYDADDLDELEKKLKEKIPKALKDEPIKFFEDIKIGYKSNQNQNENHKENRLENNCEISKLLYALHDFFYKDELLKPAIKLKLKKLKYIEIKYKPAVLGDAVEYIDITDEGAKFLEHNKMVLYNQK